MKFKLYKQIVLFGWSILTLIIITIAIIKNNYGAGLASNCSLVLLLVIFELLKD